MKDRAAGAERAFARLQRVLEDHPFSPPWWLRGGRLQTVASSLSRRDFGWGWSSCSPLAIRLRDGCLVRSLGVWQAEAVPTLVLLHGMGGSSASTYMQGLSHKAFREGWNAVLLNLYNQDQSLTPPRVFHSGSSCEVGEILEHLARVGARGPLYLAGVSMGGNLLLKLLGEWGEDLPVDVRGAAVISPLLDLEESCRLLEKPANRLFQHHFVSGFKRRVRAGRDRLGPFVDIRSLLRIRTVREFDQLFTVPLGGFRDVSEYYRTASAAALLERIRVPTLLVHARDDPFLPTEPLTRPESCANPFLHLSLTPRGGHVGFLEPPPAQDVDRFWAENRVIDYFRILSLGGY